MTYSQSESGMSGASDLALHGGRVFQSIAVESELGSMAKQSDDSGYHHRVHLGHFENFQRKLTAAESQEQLERVISTIGVAVARNMIAATDHELLTQLIQRRRQELCQ
jgi:hypothetical protein